MIIANPLHDLNREFELQLAQFEHANRESLALEDSRRLIAEMREVISQLQEIIAESRELIARSVVRTPK